MLKTMRNKITATLILSLIYIISTFVNNSQLSANKKKSDLKHISESNISKQDKSKKENTDKDVSEEDGDYDNENAEDDNHESDNKSPKKGKLKKSGKCKILKFDISSVYIMLENGEYRYAEINNIDRDLLNTEAYWTFINEMLYKKHNLTYKVVKTIKKDKSEKLIINLFINNYSVSRFLNKLLRLKLISNKNTRIVWSKSGGYYRSPTFEKRIKDSRYYMWLNNNKARKIKNEVSDRLKK